jgi:hypothetical protein
VKIPGQFQTEINSPFFRLFDDIVTSHNRRQYRADRNVKNKASSSQRKSIDSAAAIIGMDRARLAIGGFMQTGS